MFTSHNSVLGKCLFHRCCSYHIHNGVFSILLRVYFDYGYEEYNWFVTKSQNKYDMNFANFMNEEINKMTQSEFYELVYKNKTADLSGNNLNYISYTDTNRDIKFYCTRVQTTNHEISL